ncbi:BrnT family toxin [Thiothrix litoralis]|uniref:BrnT family toxin n=1 Tax=Thiothrix litoralis TaxID=2891210 RepID=A0ABX7WRT9_9GAMM|nr:BrnT family toxin [Thiothrix litoralis]QTR46399.1 BrnT family toxin [Thiothrix litoralis]
MKLTFEWDTNKEKTNIKKHGVSFVDAKTAFHDEYAMQFYDPDHSDDEDRFILLGTNHQLKTLVICHCFRQTETVIRIISARHADASEQAAYWSNRP